MEYILIIAGVVLASLGFLVENPLIKEKFVDPRVARQWVNEEEQIKQLKGEITEIKQEVVVLLAELERTSENVVSELEARVTKVQAYFHQLDHPPVQPATIPPPVQASTNTKAKAPVKSTQRPKTTPVKAKNSLALSDKNEMVYTLADQGLSLAEIAQQAKIGKGEVQLILELRGRGE